MKQTSHLIIYYMFVLLNSTYIIAQKLDDNSLRIGVSNYFPSNQRHLYIIKKNLVEQTSFQDQQPTYSIITQITNPNIIQKPTTYKNYLIDTLSRRLEDLGQNYFEGLFLGIALKTNEVGEGFDGNSYLYGTDIVALLPRMKNGIGFEVVLSGQFTYYGYDISYGRVSHKANWMDAKGDAVFNALDINVRGIPAAIHWPIKPYMIGGGGFKWLVVQDDVLKQNEIVDATFTKFGWNIGWGIEVFPFYPVLIDANAIYSYIKYTAVTPGNSDWATINGDVIGSGWSFRIGILIKLY